MLRGDSRSYIFGSGGVDIFRAMPEPIDGDESTTPPETDRPFTPNGTGGFRTPERNTCNRIRNLCIFFKSNFLGAQVYD